jgi:uncharacterized protein (DUF433 family)
MKRLRVVLRGFEESDTVKRIPRRSNQSLLDFPTYTIPEAALYLAIPVRTLRYWVLDNPVWEIAGADLESPLLSFRDVAQAYYIDLVRRRFSLSPAKTREVLLEASKETRRQYPLLQKNILVFFKHILMKKGASRKQRTLIDLTQHRQLAMWDVVKPFASRVEWNSRGQLVRIFPWRLWKGPEDSRTPVSIDPEIMSGRLVVTGTRIPVQVVLQRNLAGESVSQIAKDYRLSTSSINQAIDHLVHKAA